MKLYCSSEWHSLEMHEFAVWTGEDRLIPGITVSNLFITQDFLLAFLNVKIMPLLRILLFKTWNQILSWTGTLDPFLSSFCYLTSECSYDSPCPFPRSAPRLGFTQLLGCADSTAVGNKTREEFITRKPRLWTKTGRYIQLYNYQSDYPQLSLAK